MRRLFALICVLACSSMAVGQESGNGNGSNGSSGGVDLISPLWNFEDATPLNTGQFDLRFGGRWATGQSIGDSSDDWLATPGIAWGITDNLEMSAQVNAFLGDGGDMGPFEDGNYDTHLGFLWRFHDGHDAWPAMALSTTIRIPTGDGSSGVDAELRLNMTHDYDSGIRSHFNVFGVTVNTDNHDSINPDNFDDFDADDFRFFFGGNGNNPVDARHFQYGAVIGADGPLCGDEGVRWVADYMYRSSYFYGMSAMHIGEVGLEWIVSDVSKFGISVQATLDHDDALHDWGAGFMYSHAIGS